MSLAPGSRIGVYEILGPLGAGGMGEVYKARDSRLDRLVAIKLLPDEFARDPERLARFEREAKTLATLNHPHIAQIYGFEEMGALVMELVEGEDLSVRLARGPLPLDEALPMARQMAEALEAAHEAGIVHRDLKPANIKVGTDGSVKVLDFGLAKALAPAPGGRDFSPADRAANSPTMMSPALTMGGVILGTAAYMSPEQARGRAIDKRADIWAFGVVLHEMLTGTALFAGESITDTLAAVLTRPIELSLLPSAVPTPIRKLIGRCLERDPRRRLRDIGEARLAIEEVLAGHSETSPNVVSTVRGRSGVTLGLAGAVIGLAIGAVAAGFAARAYFAPEPRPETRVDIATAQTTDPFSFALSADGRQVAFVAIDKNVSRLWVRRLDRAEARVLPNTDGAAFPFWSPDGSSIGFFAGGKLKRLEVDGTRPTVVADASSPRGGSWGSQGEILFVPQIGPVMRVPASGGAPVAVTRVAAGDAHRSPHWLPDGRRFLYFIHSGVPERRGIYLATRDQIEGVRLAAADSGGQYAPSGEVMYVKDGMLVSHGIDLEGRKTVGEPIPIASEIPVDGTISSRGAFDVSPSGTVAYRSGLTSLGLAWLSPSGGATSALPLRLEASAIQPALSNDGRRVLVRRSEQGNDDLWMIDLVRGGSSRFTSHPSQDAFPVWSPDDRQVAFRSNRAGAFGLFIKPANGEVNEQQLLATGEDLAPTSWSRDGRWLMYYSLSKNNRDLWALPITGSNTGAPVLFLRTEFDETLGQFSPDGKWVAYQTNESGVQDIAVRPFPGPGGVWPLSSGGGTQPRWSRDGKTLYYATFDGRIISVPVVIRGTSVEYGASRAVDGSRLPMANNIYLQLYDVGPDGRLLTLMPPQGDGRPSAITLVLDWKGPK